MPRVSPPGFGARAPSIGFRFEGRVFAAASGETIAAALAAEGEATLRETRTGERRGPFCGMGLCFECLVSVDGRTVRACMSEARAGMAVTRHQPRLANTGDPASRESAPPLTTDIAIVGAGPAGLSAALMAARAGRRVTVLDERKQAGGQFHKQPAAGFPIDAARLDRQFREGRSLAQDVRAAGATMLQGVSAFAPHAGASLLLGMPEGPRRLDARRIILATGAAERCPPFPGWTLPGVMTTGAAQTFLRAYGIAPGKRVAIAGAGPLNLQLAAELVRVGIDVAMVAEASSRPTVAKLPALLRMAAAAPRLVADGARYRLALARIGVPLRFGSVVTRAEGDGHLQRVHIAPLASDGRPEIAAARVIECDLLCVGYGFTPTVDLAAAMGCALAYDSRWRHLAVETDADGRTSLPHVFAAGDGARFGGARVAMARGRIAGAAAARDLGGATPADDAQAELRRAGRFQEALWSVFDAPVLTHERADAETPVCRCEHVTRGGIEAAHRAGACSLGAIKRATRLGMGRCQGRYCAPVTAALLADLTGRSPVPDDFFAPRTPLRPVSVGALAALDLGCGA